MDNITDKIETEILYNHLYGDISGKVVLYLNATLSSLIGPILMIGIVIFEIYGGDPQKRTIVNRLLSALLFNTAIWSVILGIILISRDVNGLLNFNLAMLLRLSANFFANVVYIYYNILTIFRYLFIVIWKRMRGVQDQFWSYVFFLSAYSLSFWFNIVYIMAGFQPNQDLLVYLTKEPTENMIMNNNNTTENIR